MKIISSSYVNSLLPASQNKNTNITFDSLLSILSDHKYSPPKSVATPAKNADVLTPSAQVAISKNAQNLPARTTGGPDQWYQQFILRCAKEDPAHGDDLAKGIAYGSTDAYGNFDPNASPLMDISMWPTTYYSHTGGLVTPENLAAFKAENVKAHSDMITLYQAEKTKGTPAADILEKLFRYMDTRSDSYLNILGWERAATATA
ncbi:MAG: hypothetical protein LBV49_11355 [Azonexus sp.]|nr:hypothetical protein [Azonexus sp.]